jgi:membrane protease YdiL (CAAX protease family)
MSLERFTRADVRTIVIAAVVGAIGFGVFFRYENRAFPEASIDFKVSRPEIGRRARVFLEERGFDLTPYRQVVLFRYDDNAKTYLERELGLAEANRIMSSGIDIWRWRVRFFKPPEKEELVVWLDPSGNLVGFEHVVEEEAPGTRLEKEQARSVAEIFLRTRLGLDLADYALVEDSMDERPNRLDHRFTWEHRDFRAKDATSRVSASVYGDEIGRVLPFLKIPEQWQRDYRKLRSRNELFGTAAAMAYVPLLVAILFVLIRRAGRRVPWKTALWLGGIIGGLQAIATMNGLPVHLGSFPTNTPFPLAVILLAVVSLAIGIFYALFIATCGASGELLYRESAPDKVALPRMMSLTGLRTKEFFTATFVGYALAAAQLGFVVLFYLFAKRFGAWSPAEVKYDNFLSTALPWIYPLTIGLIATTTEEFAFRLFAIPFLKRHLKSTWLAVVIPAFVWGFLHSGYPQQPAWIRGVEIGLVGIVLGYVFLRFGIVATLVAHYTYDAIVIGLLLLRSDNLYFLLSGGIVMDVVLIPLAIAGALYWANKRFAADPEIFNAAWAQETAAEIEPAEPPLEAIPEPTAAPSDLQAEPSELPSAATPTRGSLALAAGAGLVGLALLLVPVERPLEFLRWQTDAKQAEGIADRFLRERDVDPSLWKRVTRFDAQLDGKTAEYVRRHGGMTQVNELWSTRLLGGTRGWRVRYFRADDKEEHRIWVLAGGQVSRHEHLVAEEATGADLEPVEAQSRAMQHLAHVHGLDVSDWDLVESSLERRDARVDHQLIWEDPTPVVGESHVRAQVDVIGDEVGGFRPHLKVPESWLRELDEVRPGMVLGIASMVGLFVWVLVLVARRLPRHGLRWRAYVAVGLLAGGLELINVVNGLRTFGAHYDTSVPWRTHVLLSIGGEVLSVLALVVAGMLVALGADVYTSWARISPTSERRSRLAGYRDAALAGIGGALLMDGLETCFAFMKESLRIRADSVSTTFNSTLDSFLPGLEAGTNATLAGILLSGLLVTLLGVVQTHFRSRVSRSGIVLFLLVSLAGFETVGIASFGHSLLELLVATAALLLIVRHLLRSNVLSYVVFLTAGPLLSNLFFYWGQPAMRGHAVLAVVTAAMCLVGVAFVWHRVTGTGREEQSVLQES